MAPTPPTPCCLWLRVSFASIGVLVGLSIFCSFGFVFKNWDAAGFGLLSGLFAAITLWVHITYRADQWQRTSYQLRYLMMLGCVAQLAGICGLVAYLSIAIVEHQKLTAYGPKGYYLAAVWSFIAWKWGFLLFFYGKQYRTLFEITFNLSPDSKYEQI